MCSDLWKNMDFLMALWNRIDHNHAHNALCVKHAHFLPFKKSKEVLPRGCLDLQNRACEVEICLRRMISEREEMSVAEGKLAS